MEKTILTFRADNQILTGQNVPERFASDTVSYIEAVFDLGENWSGFDAVKAVWSTDFDSLCTVLDSSGTCVVPWEVLERVGDVWVNLVGSISENDNLTDRLTTYPIKAVVVDANAAVCGSETSPVTPSQFDQFVEVVRADADRAEEGATAAAASASAAATSAAWSDERATDSSNAAYTATNARAEAERWAGEANRAQYYAWQEADNANSAARDAEEAKNTILNMTATAQTLPEGSEATVDYNNGVMAFGIPRGDTGERGAKGDTGETGATPQMSIGTVETLEPSEDASVSIRGTAEEPILDFGIPKGETGDVSLLELIANTKVDEKTDSVPYQMRTLSGVGSHESLRKIVGGTVAWNQLLEHGNFDAVTGWSGAGYGAITVANNIGNFTLSDVSNSARIERSLVPVVGHKTLVTIDIKVPYATGVFSTFQAGSYAAQIGRASLSVNTWTTVAGIRSVEQADTTSGKVRFYVGDTSASVGDVVQFRNGMIIDLTQMFGSTIADYIYSLEQATAGAGVAFFKALFPEDYYPYDEGTLKSVQTSAHKTYDADGNVIGNYALDNSITLMGVPKLDANNILYYDGDEYPPSGGINRRYHIVNLGALNWEKNPTYDGLFNSYRLTPQTTEITTVRHICNRFIAVDSTTVITENNSIALSASGTLIFVHCDAYTDAAAFKASLSDVYLVYELNTPTTETATAYTELQEVESGGTEEFVGAEIPVGHESVYPRTLADTMPTADGSYTLALTVSGGKPSVEWEVNA